MSKRTVLALLASLVACSCFAQGRFFADAEVQYVFDNHEFDFSGGQVLPSETYHFVRLTPHLGWKFDQDENLTHTLNIGVYPRSLVEGRYSEVIMSHETAQSDFNLEGMLFKYRTPRFYAELGMDWMGKYGETRKERFQIYTYGQRDYLWIFSLGWAGSFYHYAGSVDNHILQLYAMMDLARALPIKAASVKLSGIWSYQRDRLVDDLRMPGGLELETRFQILGFGLRTITSYTGDMLPFYNDRDRAGNLYGDMLYRGSKFYKGFYNMEELYWTPIITTRLNLKVSFRFHFSGQGYLGTEQRLSLLFDI